MPAAALSLPWLGLSCLGQPLHQPACSHTWPSPTQPPPAVLCCRPRGAGPAQAGLASFYRQIPKCLRCRGDIKTWRGGADDAPGLCPACAA